MTNQEIITRGELIRDEIVTGANTAQRVGEAFVAIGENLDEIEKRNEPIAFTESKALNSFIKKVFIDYNDYTGNDVITNLSIQYIKNLAQTQKYLALYTAPSGGSNLVFIELTGKGVYCRRLINGLFFYIEVDESNLASISSPRSRLTNWVFSPSCDPRLINAGVTENPLINKYLTALYVDLTNYTGEYEDIKNGLRLYGLWNNVNRTHQYYLGFTYNNTQIQIWSDNEKPNVILEKSISITGKGSLKIIAKVNWEALIGKEWGSETDKLNPSVFDKEFFYGQIEPKEEITLDGLKNIFSTRVFTDKADHNQIIKKLFIDTSGYTGQLDLSGGIKLAILSKNSGNTGLWGIQLRLPDMTDAHVVSSHWMNSQKNIQSSTNSGVYLYAEYDWDAFPNDTAKSYGSANLTKECFNSINDPRKSVGLPNLSDEVIELIMNQVASQGAITPLTGGVYGCIGDSITQGAGVQTDLDTNDPYKPLSGTAKATYGYHIAKTNRMTWYNYGLSGSTLGDVTANGVFRNGFAKENGRYTQLANNLTHLSIFFGWNDNAYGNVMKREDWLLQNYGTKIYYPLSSSLIGTTHTDGTPYTTQEQYDACNAVTGTVNGVTYSNSAEYWKALYIGSPNDNTPDTFWGAWNVVLQYLINNYPLAKILLIVPYLSSFGNSAKLMQETVRKAAHKYGLCVYDFNKKDGQLFAYGWYDEDTVSGSINNSPIRTVRGNSLLYDGTHPNEDGYKYMYPSINAKLLSL